MPELKLDPMEAHVQELLRENAQLRAARMGLPEYLLERARAVAFAAFTQEARGLPVPLESAADLEEIARELLDVARKLDASAGRG